jgi:tetratricopeptide (TPR) repeat protein
MWIFVLMIFSWINLQSQNFTFKFDKTLELPQKADEITSVFVDELSNTYLTDAGEKKILIFNPNGELTKQIPGDPNSKLFGKPVSAIVLSDGKIVVLDQGKSKILILDNEGKKLFEFGNTKNYLNSFDKPVKILKDKEDNFYVLDRGNDKIIKFNSSGLCLGAVSVKDLISFAVDSYQNVYALSEAEKSYNVQVFDLRLMPAKRFAVAVLEKPQDILANDYGEFYIIDLNKGSALHFGQNGVYLGNKIGSKMSSKGIAQFSELTSGFLVNVDSKSEKIYLYDNDFKYLQSFIVTFGNERTKTEIKPANFKVKFVDALKNFSFRDMFITNDTSYFISSDYSVTGKAGDSQLFKLSENEGKTNAAKYTLSEPAGITKFGNNIYLTDQDENRIHLFDSKSGKIISSQSNKGSQDGQVNKPKDVAVDNNGNLYVADYGNNRINIYSSQGISIGSIKSPAEGLLEKPLKVVIDGNKNLFILCEEKGIFQYNINTKELKSLSLSGITNPTDIAILDYNILLVYDEKIGSVFLFNNGILFYQFFSKGTEFQSLENVNSLYYDNQKSILYVSDVKNNITKTYKLMFEPPVPGGLEIVLNDQGNSEIRWKNSNKSASYRIWKKKINDENIQLVAKQTELNYVVKEPQNEIYKYAVQAISEDEIVSGISDFVADEYSFYLYLSDVKPDTSIELLKKIKPMNERVINERLGIVYRKLANKFKQERDFDKYFKYVNELQNLKPKNLELYLEKVKVYEELNKYQEAITELTIADKISPYNKDIFNNLVRLYFTTKDYSKILEIFNSASPAIQGSEKSLESLARALKLLNRNSDAAEVYKRLASMTENEKYYSKAGKILYDLNNIDEAMVYLQRAAGLKSEEAETYANLAGCFVIKNDLSNASLMFEEALKLDSTNAEYFYTLGKIYSKQRNTSKAISNYKRACEFDSIKTDYIFDLVDELEKANLKKEASVYLEKLKMSDSDNPLVLLRASRYQAEDSKIDEAFASISKALKLAPGNKEIKEKYAEISRLREKKNQKEPSIKIQDISLENIFPSLINYYRTNPIGTFRIYNMRNFPLDDVKITVSSPNLFFEDFVYKEMVILPNASKEVRIVVPLKNELLANSLKDPSEYELNFTLSFMPDSTDAQQLKFKDNIRTEKTRIKVESLNSIRWDDKKHLGSFINPRDENIRNFVLTQILKKYEDLAATYSDIPKNIMNAIIIWEYFRYYGFTYMPDPNFAYSSISQTNSIDFVQFAQQTLNTRTGDCDDLVTLLATCFETVGINTSYVDIPGHVFLAFDTGINANEIKSKGLTEEKVKLLWNKAWITLESTVIGKNSFVESWLNSNERYTKTVSENKPVVPVQFRQAWEVFPPVQFPENVKMESSLTDVSIIRNAIIGDVDYYYSLTKGNVEYELLSSVKKHPDNPYLLNKLAMYYVKSDSLSKAKIYFENALKFDNANQVTLNNLANIYFKEGNFNLAEEYWSKANKLTNETNAGILVNLAKVKIAQGDKLKAREYFDKALLINKDVALKFTNLYKSIYQ